MSQRPQVRPATEGWKQKLDEKTGKPLLQFAEVKRGKPPAGIFRNNSTGSQLGDFDRQNWWSRTMPATGVPPQVSGSTAEGRNT